MNPVAFMPTVRVASISGDHHKRVDRGASEEFEHTASPTAQGRFPLV
jgi:hypothetical protein